MNIGGIDCVSFDLSKEGLQYFAKQPYCYYYYKGKMCDFDTPKLEAFVLYPLSNAIKFKVNNEPVCITDDEVLFGNKISISSADSSDEVAMLIAGVYNSNNPKIEKKIQKKTELKYVAKPWGHEIWISGDGQEFVFKEIFLKKGFKTSLQFHVMKEESNLIYSGDVRVHYKDNSEIENYKVTANDIKDIELNGVWCLSVKPKTIHRIEALSDILLYEISTPYLDDVIRIQDDTKRVNGRIEAEHVGGGKK